MSMVLSAAELSSMRDCAESYFPDTCTIRTVTRAADGLGGWTWGTADATAVPCRLDIIKMQDRYVVEGEQVAMHDVYYLTVPYDQTLTDANYVQHSSVWYDVVGLDARASWLLEKRALIKPRSSVPGV